MELERVNKIKDEFLKKGKPKPYVIEITEQKLLEKEEREIQKKIDNKKKANLKTKERWKWDIKFKIKGVLSSGLRSALKKNKKSGRTIELLGCTIEEFKKYIESKFTEGMSWENYGLRGWHIDHIIACDTFDLSQEEAQRFCFHYTNLQPLWGGDNLRKNAKVDYQYLVNVGINPDILKFRYRKKLLHFKRELKLKEQNKW